MAQAKLNRTSVQEAKQLHKGVDKRSRSMSVVKQKKKPAPSLWDEIAALRAQVPPEEWDKLPTDMAKNVDHYLYGHPKVDY